MQDKISKTFSFAAVTIQNKVLLFGGAENPFYKMYAFDEEGGLLEDLSADPLIPGWMCEGTFVV